VPLSILASVTVWPIDRPKAKAQTVARPGLNVLRRHARRSHETFRYAALFSELKLSLIGSAVSVATFCACWVKSFACAVNVSNWLRI
jgi:hypothetical protein